jgi:uncharacterized protein (TIGR02145 family)
MQNLFGSNSNGQQTKAMIITKPTYDKLLHLPQISYGRLYNWFAASNANIAPVGYSVPTDAQLTTLTNYITAEIAASRLPDVGEGNVLKSQRQSGASGDPIIPTTTHPYWGANATHYGRDSVKFTALPGGLRDTDGSFSLVSNYGYWWSSSQSDASNGWRRRLDYYNADVNRFSLNKPFGFSVRFMRTATAFEQSHFADGSFVGQVMDVDNNVYDLVKIGTQVWSVQNLATTRYNDGTAIALVTDNAAWEALETPAYCNYNNDADNVFLGSTVKTIWKTLRDREI